MENLGIFYDHLVYFMTIGNILWPFGIFCGDFVFFSPFWYFGPRKIWQPCFECALKSFEIPRKKVLKVTFRLTQKEVHRRLALRLTMKQIRLMDAAINLCILMIRKTNNVL
jgi:hypothetical protein